VVEGISQTPVVTKHIGFSKRDEERRGICRFIQVSSKLTQTTQLVKNALFTASFLNCLCNDDVLVGTINRAIRKLPLA
jgi:hypothetical protein